MIPTVTKYELLTPLQLRDICKNEKVFFPGKKNLFVNRLILIFKNRPRCPPPYKAGWTMAVLVLSFVSDFTH